MIDRAFLAATIGITLIVVSACSNGPSTQADLCQTFDKLGSELAHANGFFDNVIFQTAGDLGDLAARFPQRDLSADAASLKEISGSDSTSSLALARGTEGIAQVCGHPLSANALFGG